MNWELAITRNRDALLRLLAMMLATVGVVAGGSVAVLPRHVHRIVLRSLRPAEAALRRLIIARARGLFLAPLPKRPFPATPIARSVTGEQRAPCFRLIEPLKRFAATGRRYAPGPGPRISVPGLYDPVMVEPRVALDGDPIGAAHLCRRLHAMHRALENLPGQARRLARWTARRDLTRPGRITPLRPGTPPGYRKRQRHEIDEVLSDCHTLARLALEPPNTS